MKKLTLVVLSTLAFSNLQAASQKDFEPSFYGFIKASSIFANQAVASYHNINLSAPTHATAITTTRDEKSRTSFQTQQSRLGFGLSKKNMFGKVEFDFIDFNKSSPTTQANPRLRIASITYQLDENNKFIFGQDWDLFSPVTASTFDYVGLYFMAGNTGFMRQQVQYLHQINKYELAAAIGMAGNNPNVSDSDLETTKTPTLSTRLTQQFETGRLGLSAIYGQIQYQSESNKRYDSYALNAFFESKINQTVIKTETYYGENVANLGLLGIGRGTPRKSLKEWGAHLSVSCIISEKQVLFGGIGTAAIINQQNLLAHSIKTSGQIDNQGILTNLVTRIGYEYKLESDLSWITEISRYQTKTKLSNKDQLNIVPTIESGIQLNF